jgi:hypothetical protein
MATGEYECRVLLIQLTVECAIRLLLKKAENHLNTHCKVFPRSAGWMHQKAEHYAAAACVLFAQK